MAPNNSQSSFIPKRGATRTARRKPVKQVFVFTIFAYSVTFAALLAAGASYLYKNYTISVFESEVVALNNEINTFSVGNLSIVSEFDLTLRRAAGRLDNAASVVVLLEAVEDAIVNPAQIIGFTVERLGDEEMVVEAEIASQSFDSALFQRKILNTDERLFSEVLIQDVTLALSDEENESAEALTSLVEQPISFTATLRVPIDSLPYINPNSPIQPASNSTNNQTAL